MKKTYIEPHCSTYNVAMQNNILNLSGGVTTGSKLGNAYNSSDESYSKEENQENISLWDLY